MYPTSNHAIARLIALLLSGFSLPLLAGCGGGQMHDQPKIEALEHSDFFENGQGGRNLVADTVARGTLESRRWHRVAKVDGVYAETVPIDLSPAMLQRGQQRYNIFCAPCHDRSGYGEGMVVQRGYPPVPSLHIDRLRRQSPGYIYEIIANGLGRMPAYKRQIPIEDRWAIVAYVQALQLSQHAPRELLAPEDLRAIENARNEASAESSPDQPENNAD